MGGFVDNALSQVSNAFNSVVKGIGNTVKAVAHNPLPLIEAAAITYATGGLGTAAAEGVLGTDAIGAAAAGNATAYTAISTAVPAAVSNAAVAALNGGNISQIATAGITAGLSAGMAQGLSATQVIQNLTQGMDPAMAQTLVSATGQSVGGAISAIIQGKDPLTGAVSGAVSGALTSSLSNGQIAELSKANASFVGATAGAATTAGLTGGNVGAVIGNSLVYGAAKLALNGAYSSFSNLQKNLQSSIADYNKQQADLQAKQTTAADLADKLDTAANAYADAKIKYETGPQDAASLQAQVDAMTQAANTYDSLKPQYDAASADLNTGVDTVKTAAEQIKSLNTQVQSAGATLQNQYDSFVSTLSEQDKTAAGIQARVDAMSPEAQAAYKDAIDNGASATDGLAAASKVQAQTAPEGTHTTADPAVVAEVKQAATEPVSQFQQPTADLASAVDNGDGTTTETFADGTTQVVDAMSGNILSQTAPTGGLPAVADNTAPPTDGAPPADAATTGALPVDTGTPPADAATTGALPVDTGTPPADAADTGALPVDTGTPTETLADTGTPPADVATTGALPVDTGAPTEVAADTGGLPVDTGAPTETTDTTLTPSTLDTVAQTNQTALINAIDSNNSDLVDAVVNNNPEVIAALANGDVETATSLLPQDTSNQTDIAASPIDNTQTADAAPTENTQTTDAAPAENTQTADAAPVDNTEANGYSGDVNIPISAGGFKTAQSSSTAAPLTAVSAAAPTGQDTMSTSGTSGTSGAALDLTPHFIKGSQISLIGAPTFGYAEGSSVSFQPQIARGHAQPLQSLVSPMMRPQVGHLQFAHHKEGHSVSDEHQPEFYSEGGLKSMEHTYVKGDGDGTSDSIPAMLANGEFVIPAEVVAMLGNGSNDSGASVLDEFLKVIREHKRDANPEKLPPDSKGPLAYLQEAYKKVA